MSHEQVHDCIGQRGGCRVALRDGRICTRWRAWGRWRGRTRRRRGRTRWRGRIRRWRTRWRIRGRSAAVGQPVVQSQSFDEPGWTLAGNESPNSISRKSSHGWPAAGGWSRPRLCGRSPRPTAGDASDDRRARRRGPGGFPVATVLPAAQPGPTQQLPQHAGQFSARASRRFDAASPLAVAI